MSDPTRVLVGVILAAAVVAAVIIVFLRFNASERGRDDTVQPRHRAATAEPIRYYSVSGVYIVQEAPKRATIPAELVMAAKCGGTPNLIYRPATERGDVFVMGTHDAGEGKVCYALGGLDPERRGYDAVRIV